MRTIFNQEQALEQNCRFARLMTEIITDISSVINRFCKSDEDITCLSGELVNATTQALNAFIDMPVFMLKGLEIRRDIFDKLQGVNRAAIVSEYSARVLWSENIPLNMHPEIPSPFYMAFQIELTLQEIVSNLEKYVQQMSPSSNLQEILVNYFRLQNNCLDNLRESARQSAIVNFQNTIYTQEAPQVLNERSAKSERKRIFEERFLHPMDVFEGELFQMRVEWLLYAVARLEQTPKIQFGGLDQHDIFHQINNTKELSKKLEIISSEIGGLKIEQIQANIIAQFGTHNLAKDDRLSLFPKVIDNTTFLTLSDDEKEIFLNKIVSTVNISTESISQGYFPERYKTIDHFRELLSLPGVRFIFKETPDEILGFELALLGELPIQFESLQSEYQMRYGKIGLLRLICIHPQYRGRGLYQTLDERTLIESIGLTNVNMGRVLMSPEPNRAAISHITHGHIPLNEFSHDSDGTTWVPFSISCNRFLRQEDKRSGIVSYTSEFAKEVFEQWEEMTPTWK